MFAPAELKARARRLVEEVFNQGDLAVVDDLIAPDYTHHHLFPGEPPAPGVEGVKAFVDQQRQAFPDLHGIVEDEIAEGDRMVQRVTVRGTHQGELFGIAPTGNRISFTVIDINRAGADGKFVEHWSLVDMLGLLQQLGVLPAGAAAPRPKRMSTAGIRARMESQKEK